MSSQPPSSNANLHDIITEESPPAYTQYPNSGEQSMAFGPSRPFTDNTTQNVPQQQQTIYQAPPNQHTNPPPLQNYNVPYNNNYANNTYGGNIMYSLARPTNYSSATVIPINTQVITTPLRYLANQITYSTGINSFAPARPPNSNVVYVKPGDPSIGGWLCPSCQGLGRVNNMQLCTRCKGVGRVFN